MKKLLTQGQLSVLIVFAVLIIDQIIKILVKTNMYWHESIRITDWFYIYFTENNGMAFGMEIFGKLFLTTFRIVAVGLIIWYLAKIVKQNYKTGYIVCISLILAGILTECKLLQYSNAPSPNDVRLSGRCTSCIYLAPPKAVLSIVSTLSGIFTDVSAALWKA